MSNDGGAVNSAMASVEFRDGNVAAAAEFLSRFDGVFQVIEPTAQAGQISDAQVEALIAERNAAKKSRNFTRSDQIRDELLAQGIVLEDTKTGIRWKRK